MKARDPMPHPTTQPTTYERAVRAKRETGDERAVPVDGNEGA